MSETLAPWRSLLARSLHLNRALPNARYCQLATLTLEGKPANRTVVFRGFREGSDCLQMITDRRSEKIPQILQCPQGEICWYFPKTREQFRLSGTIILITAEETHIHHRQARDRVWQELSDAARLQFAWPCPKQPRPDFPVAFTPELPSAKEPDENFCILLFEAMTVDHLQLKGNPQDRTLYTRTHSGHWQMEAVNP
jgi:PPOX class probable FMN-dependent enzyme